MLKGIYIPDNFIDQYIEKKSMYIRIINERCDNGQIDVKTKSLALKSLDHLYEDMFHNMVSSNEIKLV